MIIGLEILLFRLGGSIDKIVLSNLYTYLGFWNLCIEFVKR